jgi:hypothetical protein
MYGWIRITRPSRTGEDNCRIGLDFDATASAAPALVHEHDDEIVDVKEPLRVELTLFPSFEVLSLKRVEHLRKTASDPALPRPPIVPCTSTFGSSSSAIANRLGLRGVVSARGLTPRGRIRSGLLR